ncbi:anaerobic typically selenocysteine-containing protein [Methylobacterium sp. CM6247]
MTVENGGAKCAPAELRLPANSDVEMDIVNKSTSQITLTAPRIFENKNVLHHDGDLVHVASNDGYLVKANGQGVLKVRTIVEGNYPYGCTSVTNQSKPFEGKLVLTPPNQ